MAKSNRAATVIYTTSFLLHAGAGVAIAAISIHRAPPTIAVTMRSVEPQPEEVPPPPPPPPEPEARHHRAAAPPPEAPPEAPPPEAPPPPDYGIALGNVGEGGPGGIAVPVGDPSGVRREPATRTQTRTLATPAPEQRAHEGGCEEAEVRPHPISMPRPAYTDAAREAAIEGRVRIELSVDDGGRVTSSRVLSSLGYGLDEAALAAVRDASFEPATRCGRAVSTTFVLSVRFTL